MLHCVMQGDLVIEFELLFPTCLSQQQKMLLRAGLFLPAKPSQAQAKALREFEAAFRDTAHGWSTGVVKQGAGDS
jgi:DnaJ family protein B protein 13